MCCCTVDVVPAFTVEQPMAATDWPLIEYACHEGNYAMPNTLAGARAEDAEAYASR